MGGCLRPLLALAAGCAAAVAVAAAGEDLTPALAIFNAGRWADARVAFERLAAADPANPEVNAYLADVATLRGDPAAALGYLSRVPAGAAGNAHVQNALGDAYGLMALQASFLSKLDLALKSKGAYERAVALEPANVDYRFSLMEYFRQAPVIAGGGLERAWSEAAAIAKLDPQRGRLARAVLDEAGEKFDAAFAELDRALASDRNDYGALYELGNAAVLSGRRLGEGLAALRRCLALAVPPNRPEHASAAWRVGCILAMRGDAAGARLAYRTALGFNPDFKPASEALARLRPD